MSTTDRISNPRVRLALAALLLYACWLGMLAVHELGHAMHAWNTRGSVVSMTIPWFGFSQTLTAGTSYPRYVVWGGAEWGCGIPLLACGLALLVRGRRGVPELLKFFTGFCLIANGLYLGLFWMGRNNDASDLVRMGESPLTLIAFGIVATVSGFYMWHKLTWLILPIRPRGSGNSSHPEGKPSDQAACPPARTREEPGIDRQVSLMLLGTSA
jgi:hypothetical protein